MSILRAPKLTTEYTGNLEQDLANLRREYLEKQTKMLNEFTVAFIIAIIVTVIVTFGVIIYE